MLTWMTSVPILIILMAACLPDTRAPRSRISSSIQATRRLVREDEDELGLPRCPPRIVQPPPPAEGLLIHAKSFWNRLT